MLVYLYMKVLKNVHMVVYNIHYMNLYYIYLY